MKWYNYLIEIIIAFIIFYLLGLGMMLIWFYICIVYRIEMDRRSFNRASLSQDVRFQALKNKLNISEHEIKSAGDEIEKMYRNQFGDKKFDEVMNGLKKDFR